jgi:hypothetical protein
VHEELLARLERSRAEARREAELARARRRGGMRDLMIAAAVLGLAPAWLVLARETGSDAFLAAGMLFAAGGLGALVTGITLVVTGKKVSEQRDPWNALVAWFSFVD